MKVLSHPITGYEHARSQNITDVLLHRREKHSSKLSSRTDAEF